MKPWKKRINISIDSGNDKLVFLNKSGLVLAIGYVRVVIGKRGPYVEFTKNQIQWNEFKIPDEEVYRLTDERVFYVEYRSIDKSYVKLYLQKRTVSYADYKIDFCYISPADLMMASTCPILST